MGPDSVQVSLDSKLRLLNGFYSLLQKFTLNGNLDRITYTVRILLEETKALQKLAESNKNLTPKLQSSIQLYISFRSHLETIFKHAENWRNTPTDTRLEKEVIQNNNKALTYQSTLPGKLNSYKPAPPASPELIQRLLKQSTHSRKFKNYKPAQPASTALIQRLLKQSNGNMEHPQYNCCPEP